MFSRLSTAWFPNVRADLLAGLVVALALIPESIAFSVIANVDPQVCLFASVVIAVTIAFVGGRSAMISASTGAIALLVGNLVKDHGLAYLLAASMLTGVIQIILGMVNVANVMRFVSASVMTGFVNALAILYMITQAKELILAGNMGSWATFPLVAGGLAIIYLFPRLTKAIPSPLIAIVVISIIANYFQMDVRRVKDLGILPTGLPYIDFATWKMLPVSLDTLWIILPVSLSFSVVGLLESLMTAQILDEFTDTPSDKNKEARGSGHCQYRIQSLRRHRGLRDDRPVSHQREIGRPGQAFDAYRWWSFAFTPAGNEHTGRQYSDGGIGGSDDHGLDRHVQLDDV